MRIIFLLSIFFGFTFFSFAKDWPKFGGENGNFISDEKGLLKDWKDKETVKYLDEVTKAPETGEDSEGNGDSEKDEFYDQAVAFVVETRRASISAVQRKFRIGYNRAARLIETMESAGLVSEMNSNGNREVLAPNNAE